MCVVGRVGVGGYCLLAVSQAACLLAVVSLSDIAPTWTEHTRATRAECSDATVGIS